MTLQEKQAQDELVSHLREENNKLREMYALATERAEKAEAVVNAARAVAWLNRDRHDSLRPRYNKAADALYKLEKEIDAYDAKTMEGK